MTLEGGRFFSSGGRTHNRFGGFLEAQVARFEFQVTGFNYYQYFYTFPDVFEELPGAMLFGIEGRSDAAVSRSGMTGTLRGTIGTYPNPPSRSIARCPRRVTDCHSPGERMRRGVIVLTGVGIALVAALLVRFSAVDRTGRIPQAFC